MTTAMNTSTKRKITRNREFKACTECRRRKLKCDHTLPCSACVRRSDEGSCAYESNLNRGPQRRRDRNRQAEARLEHLEQLVRNLSSQNAATGSDSSDVSSSEGYAALPLQQEIAGLTFNDTPPSASMTPPSGYHGSTHWSAMLDDIHDLRETLQDYDDHHLDDGMGEESDGNAILFGGARTMSFADVLSTYLPPREEVNPMVATYFRAKALSATFVHGPQFNRQYQRFWEDPLSAPPLWTSILFTILDLTSRKLSDGSSGNQFAIAAAHCLACGSYYRPQAHAVQALLIYAQARCVTSLDFSPDLATMFGTLIRLATAMGYHRDPDNTPGKFTAFEGEIRRRTWSLCMQLDILVSFQLGLPPNVPYGCCDSKKPSNFLDVDFDEDIVTLPPERPPFEITEQLFYISKHQLFFVFEKIVRHGHATAESNIEELQLINAELEATYRSLPAVLAPRTLSESVVDSPSVIVTRLCVYFVYLNCVCVLHRKYVVQGRPKSVQACSEAAVKLIAQYVDTYPAFQAGGQLETERWYIGAISWHDFLLACMALCLVVGSLKEGRFSPTLVNLSDLVTSLRQAQMLCQDQAARSHDTRRAIKAIHATLAKVDSSSLAMPPQIEDAGEKNGALLDGSYTNLSTTDDWIWGPEAFPPTEDATWSYLEQVLDIRSLE